jgi:hypothetical protein
MSSGSLDTKKLEQTCENLVNEPEIRFAGFLDMMGNLIAGKFKPGIEPLKDDSDRKKMFIEAVLRVRTRQEFDENLGPVKYAAARREKVVTLTFLVDNTVLFISANPDIDIDDTAKKILGII